MSSVVFVLDVAELRTLLGGRTGTTLKNSLILFLLLSVLVVIHVQRIAQVCREAQKTMTEMASVRLRPWRSSYSPEA
jgi:hypothetical protein